LNLAKKALSIGTSAALVASLLATVVAPSVAASTLVGSAGVVPVGGTSTAASSYQFCENAAGDWHAGGTIIVTISPYTAGGAVTFTNATGGAPAPTVTQNPGGLGGVTATALGSVLTITVPTDDNANALCLTVGNLYISAAAGTTTGAINAAVAGTGATTPASFASSTTSATGIVAISAAAGATDTTSVVNVTSACGFVTPGTLTGTTAAGDFVIGGVDISATGSSSSAGTVSTVPASGQETLTFAGNLAPTTTAGVTTVTQANVANCSSTTLASPGTVGNAVTQTAVTGTANPGEQNQVTGTTTITETAAGYLAAGTVLTFTISAPTSGVTFSSSPTAFVTAGNLTLGSGFSSALCVLQFGGTSCQVTVDAASTVASSITLAGATAAGILIDMASTVPNGTAVNVSVTGSPAITVNLSSNTIANASRVIVGVASQPTIYINYNAQPSGMITLTEAGPGFFTASGVNDAFGLCITTGESFTYTPYAIVASGDLKLLTSTSTAATTQQGTLYTTGGMSCVMWSVYSASTVASTIDIVGATASGPLAVGAANGPTLSVPGYLHPGTTQSVILVGSQAGVMNGTASSSLVSNATRMFKSGVVVAALSQPAVVAGTTDTLAGNLTISETLNGQFKPLQTICVVILPRASNGNRIQDTFIKTTNTNDLPVITTNAASGLLTSSVGTPGCGALFTATNTAEGVVPTPGNSFSFTVNQQSFGGTLGVITVGNIHLITTADAPTGPVLVDVLGTGTSASSVSETRTITSYTDSTTGSAVTVVTAPNTLVAGEIVTITGTTTPNINGTYVVQSATATTFTIVLPAALTSTGEGGTVQGFLSGANGSVAFETVVSNAKIGVEPKLNIAANSALGLNPKVGYTMLTPKYQVVGKYVTWKFTGGTALAGQRVNILVAKHFNGAWGGPVYYKSAWADANGIVTFAWTSKTAAAINVRVQWPGSAVYAASISKALGAYHK
jgi:hypothetical protein